MHLDLSDLISVRNFAAEFKDSKLPLNILVNNGGIALCKGPKHTPDGLELMFATNFLGRFLLTNLLLDTMKATAKESGIEGRVVIVSGAIYNFTPKGGIAFDKLINTNEIWGFSGYGQTKLAGILHLQGVRCAFKGRGCPHYRKHTLPRPRQDEAYSPGWVSGLFLRNDAEVHLQNSGIGCCYTSIRRNESSP